MINHLNEKENDKYFKFIQKAQLSKMKELWDNKEDEYWEYF